MAPALSPPIRSWNKVTATRLRAGDLLYSFLWPRKEDKFRYSLQPELIYCLTRFIESSSQELSKATFLGFEKRLACRLEEIRFTAFEETHLNNIMALCRPGLCVISVLLISMETMLYPGSYFHNVEIQECRSGKTFFFWGINSSLLKLSIINFSLMNNLKGVRQKVNTSISSLD